MSKCNTNFDEREITQLGENINWVNETIGQLFMMLQDEFNFIHQKSSNILFRL